MTCVSFAAGSLKKSARHTRRAHPARVSAESRDPRVPLDSYWDLARRRAVRASVETIAIMSERIRELAQEPVAFLNEGTQFLNRCTKPGRKGMFRSHFALPL